MSSSSYVAGAQELPATFIDPPSQAANHDEQSERPQERLGRLTFLQAWDKVSKITRTDSTPDDMVRMPANKRRCLEEKLIDVAMNDGHAKVKWQVWVLESSVKDGCGDAWADMEAEWAEDCEQVYAIVQD